ncbi:hypothetical protein CSB09_00200 [Candidatus Gracilibacteria bacterium]|nr:MAG: hypothetical protein CSB09_00200 [Candidatus Gracilibacteria bacterium]
MEIITALAHTFDVTFFDVIFAMTCFVFVFVGYYFISLHSLYEIAFGAIVGLAVYILLVVLLLSNPSLGTSGGLLPFGLSVFVVSIAVYLVLLLAVFFPFHGGLVVSETTNPILYSLQYMFVGFFLCIGLFSVVIYMIEQAYIFRVGTLFVWLRDWQYYQESIRPSFIFEFVMSHQNIIIPLAVVLMVYKLMLSNIVSAAFLSIIYNIGSIGFYRKKSDSHYRVEFHEVGAHADEEGGDENEDHSSGEQKV